MKVEFTREGGLAYFPTLNKPVTIDTDSFSPEDTQEFQRLLDEANFFDLPAQPQGSTSRGADRYQYTIHVQRENQDHKVHLIEPVDDANQKALLDFLSTKVQGMTK